MRKGIICAALVVALVPVPLAAHGVDVFLETGGTAYPAQTVRFGYSTGEAMSFAKVKVFAPANPGVETVQSITDRNGYFSFIPDETGEWRVSAEDGMGHKGEITVPAALPEPGGPGLSPPKGGPPRLLDATRPPRLHGRWPLGIALGLSLILNIFWAWRRLAGVMKGVTARRRAHAH